MTIVRIATTALLLAGQVPQPPIRTGTHAIEIDARVVDKDGRFVTTLTISDFEILEEGASQEIVDVYLVTGGHVTTAASSPAGAPAGVPVAATRQTWIFVFDTVHLSPGSFNRTRDGVLRFVRERFQDGHLAGVVAGGRMINNRLTTTRSELEQAIAGLKMPAGGRSRELDLREWPRFRDEAEAVQAAANDRETIANIVRRACEEDPSACARVSPEDAVREKGRRISDHIRAETGSSLATIDTLSSGLARIPGAKTVVFVSEGMVTERLLNELQRAVGQATRSGARLYTVDARGLNRGSGAGIIDQPMADNAAGAGVTFDLRSDGTASLAVDTGGFAIRNENDFGRALDLIARDSESYYVIGYRPSNQTFDGKYRTIEVKVRGSGLKVRARRGYVALEPARMLTAVPVTPPPPAAAPDTPAPPSAISEAPIPALPPRMRTNAPDMVLMLADRSPAVPATGDPAADGWAAYQRGDLTRAAVLLKEAAAGSDTAPWISYALGFAHIAQGAHADAARAWETVRAAAPDFEPVYFDLADVYVQMEDESRAVEILREAEKRFPSSADIFNALGVIQTRRGALDDAVRSFARAVKVAPEDALGYFNLGRSYQMRYMKTVRYVATLRKWMGNDDDRERAAANLEKYVAMGGPYIQQARDALAALAWK